MIARNKGTQFVSWCRKVRCFHDQFSVTTLTRLLSLISPLQGYDSMLQTLKILLDERSVVLGNEINQDEEVKSEEDLPAEDLETLQHGEAGSNGEYDWSDEIESVDIEPVRNDEEQNETATAVETDSWLGRDGVGDGDYGGEDQDQEEEAREIHWDHGDVNDEEISEL